MTCSSFGALCNEANLATRLRQAPPILSVLTVKASQRLQFSYCLILPELFMGHAMDAFIIVKKQWEDIDVGNETLTRAIKLLSSTYTRFGGIFTDRTIFVRKRP